ncbi:hypothetical protein DXD54_08515 [Clostridium sp. TM06-18]|nr:hypothetical protein [Clostridium sp. TM06-18]RHU37224.1 hypothetical protein DXD54_08515 [Clostridium sp. TM06-18]
MNDIHMQQILKHYIDDFEKLNDPEHMEYYKWQIVKKFRPMMDEALETDGSEFAEKLMEVKKITSNLVDSYTQPFYGLVKFAEKEPDIVKKMFRELFVVSAGPMEKRQVAVLEFLKKSHELRDKYYPDSFLYKDDMHSVTTYLFLYDPDHNYIFKSSHALIFADCIEFYDDWGSGDSVKLDVYYRMCDQIASAVKHSPEMMKTDASRFENGWGVDPATFAPDAEKHILVFDLIYCCSTYGLFEGITFTRPKTKEKQLIQEKREKALRLSKDLEEARANYEKLTDALRYLDEAYAVGTAIQHKKYGDGKITDKHGTTIEVNFKDGDIRKLGIVLSAVNGIIVSGIEGYSERIREYRDILKKESSIRSAVSFAEKNFAPYAEYLE